MTSEQHQPKRGARGALSLSFLQKGVTFAFTFASVTLISRLLTPSEVGVFSVAVGFLALVHMLRDFGVSEYVVQEAQLDQALVRTAFTLNLVIAWCLGGIVFAASGMIGDFFANQGVTQVLRVMSIVFFVLPFCSTTMALLRREFAFGKVAVIGICESVTRSTTAIVLAYAGFSYMSLAWAALAGIGVTTLGCMVWGGKHRMTGLGLTGWRRVLRFGSIRTVADIARQLGDQSANIITGKVLGMASAGLYSRGYGVVNMYEGNVYGAIGAVAFPAFAREHRETAAAPDLFLKSLVYITGISWPFFACGILLASPIINILFGSQWDAAIPLMRWLCAAALIGTLMYYCSSFLIALGRVGIATRVDIEYQIIRIGITLAAVFYGLQAVAAVQVLVYAVAVILYYRVMCKYDALAMRKCVRALLPSAFVTLATCAVPAAIVFYPGLLARHELPAFLAALVGGGLGWLVGIALVRHPLLLELQNIIGRLRGNRQSAAGRP